jgi:hypothetical protein
VQRGLKLLSKEEGIEDFIEYFEEKYTLKKWKMNYVEQQERNTVYN